MNRKNKKVLVAGEGSFIGSHLTERLVELGADVSALARYNSKKTKKEMRNKVFVDMRGVIDKKGMRESNHDLVIP